MDAARPSPVRPNAFAGLAIAALFLLAALYPLSIGPIYWLCEHQRIHEELIVFYVPLIWLTEKFAPLNALLSAYLELWQW